MKQVLTLMIATAVAALVFAPVAWAGDVEGKIKSVDPTGRMLTLDDGTQLVIPSSVRVERRHLAPGADVKASFEQKGDQKIVTAISVQPAQSK